MLTRAMTLAGSRSRILRNWARAASACRVLIKAKPRLLREILERDPANVMRSEEHTSELQSPDHPVCRLLLEKKKPLQSSTHSPVPWSSLRQTSRSAHFWHQRTSPSRHRPDC